ncbi:hypothetical protein ACFO5Q_16555 [Kordiimonas lipolytica]|uniref:Lipoprotein n=1 Tax=Kordiimonas lipolytica TaxID=1662421 RepID=A0ABV8UF34_9PROT|nr:hypothetical protein [Kordiimonas lipolytica]
MRSVSILLVLMLAGCGAYGAKPLQTPEAQALNAGSLNAYHLSLWPGQCALVLRPRTEDGTPAQAPIFAQTEDNVTMVVEGRQMTLRRSETSEERVADIPRGQTFTAPTLKAKLMLRQSVSETGAPLQGVLSLTKPNGWSTVIPVDGGRQCRQ